MAGQGYQEAPWSMRTGLEIEISSIIRVNLPTMIRIGFGQGAPCPAGFGDWIDPREFERSHAPRLTWQS